MPCNCKRKMTRNFTETYSKCCFASEKWCRIIEKSDPYHWPTLSRWVNNKNNPNFGSGHKITILLEAEELLVYANG